MEDEILPEPHVVSNPDPFDGLGFSDDLPGLIHSTPAAAAPAAPAAPSAPSLTEEQQRRMELNRQRALERKLSRQQQHAGQHSILFFPYLHITKDSKDTPSPSPPQMGQTCSLLKNSSPSVPNISTGPVLQPGRRGSWTRSRPPSCHRQSLNPLLHHPDVRKRKKPAWVRSRDPAAVVRTDRVAQCWTEENWAVLSCS